MHSGYHSGEFDKQGFIFFLKFLAIVTLIILIGKATISFFTPTTPKAPSESFIETGAPAIETYHQKITVGNIQYPRLNATAYLIADLDSGQILASKHPNDRLAIASLSKLVTALVSIEHFDSKTGQRWELYPLLMESSNEAAEAIANSYNRKLFIKWMNQEADYLGMKQTNFADPSGLSADNRSSANDLLILLQRIQKKAPIIFEISRTPTKTLIDGGDLRNINLFANDPRFIGGKTGYTGEAKEVMVAIFRLPIQGSNHNLAFILLGSEDRAKDMGTLIWWAQRATKQEKPLY